jgi:hypothetical protein
VRAELPNAFKEPAIGTTIYCGRCDLSQFPFLAFAQALLACATSPLQTRRVTAPAKKVSYVNAGLVPGRMLNYVDELGQDVLRFATGMVVGLALGMSATAFAVVLAGDSGYASGWSVTKDGEEICSDPYVWVSSREIECE